MELASLGALPQEKQYASRDQEKRRLDERERAEGADDQ
jgi:hypothetical protein